jgi:GWxTD domain-containing protein
MFAAADRRYWGVAMKDHRFPITLALAAAALLPVVSARAMPQEKPTAQATDETAPSKQSNKPTKGDRKLLKELDTPFRRWLEEDVAYIITPEEKSSFLRLTTNEEREQYIEAFWQRRNPNPESPDNEYKDEYYRRIAYANARFASGLPGWKTDRGRIYIVFGPPDERDSHPSGGAYERLPEEGGGSTTAYPFEDWRYRHIDGIGDDINLEFVDTSWGGEYHLTMDPCEKDALAHTATGGISMTEASGDSTRASRFSNTNGTTCSKSQMMDPIDPHEFTRVEQFAAVLSTPQLHNKEMEGLVTSKVLHNQLIFEYKVYFMRVTSDTVLVPITVQVANRQLTFQSKDGVHSAVLDVYGRITTLTGKVIQTFEDKLNRDFPDALMHQSLQGQSVYQKGVPLRSGLYRLDLVVKDVQSGNVGVISTRLAVPKFDDTNLTASTMILADQMENVGSKQIGLGQFVIGDAKVRPRVNGTFAPGERMSVYVQVYNLTVDEKTHKSDTGLVFTITRIDSKEPQEVFRKREAAGDQPGQTGTQLTLQKHIPLAGLEPGRYKFAVEVTDNISKQTTTPSAEFTVGPAPSVAAAKN